MEHAIELNGVKKGFKNFTLGPITMCVPKGCIIGYIGENGAGKSTTIKLLLGLVKPDAGEIKVLGSDISKIPEKAKSNIGYVFDDLFLPSEMNLMQAHTFCTKLYRDAWNENNFQRLIKKFNLPEKKALKHFSRGMKMQLGMALALSHGAKLLLLDEATSGLDPVIRDDVLDLLLEYIQNEENTVFVSSHILSDLEKVADYIAFIHRGQLLLMEAKDTLTEKYGLATLSDEQLQSVNQSAIIGKRKHQFGTEVLLERNLLPPHFKIEKPSIEDIMVYIIKGDNE